METKQGARWILKKLPVIDEKECGKKTPASLRA